ncbi:sensor histidine kinase [Actinomadura rupiterrae]|uniref:sensor histidine kinase n=1 Tax=Actinomadura rupiterrae TaxID=559627 RepID=UPI0020A42EC1|nr:sensor histidine kinase [Actinomadura rupiterrae]MCP2334939.1 signal transduction histidine kinase [Actinomadura rupiterrae]
MRHFRFWDSVVPRLRRVLPWTVRALAGCYVLVATALLLNQGAGVLALPLALLAGGPVVVAWRRPGTAIAVLVADALAVWAVAPRATMVVFVPVVSVLAPLGYRARAAVSCAGFAAATELAVGLGWPGGAIVFSVAFTLVWTAAVAARLHRVYTERLAAERTRRGIAEERLRIARELHDVVAHGMSVITVQAGFGALVGDERPAEARAALGAIEATGRRTLVELRALLGVLRADGDADLAPSPGLADLPGLVERTARAGLAVRVERTGPERELPAGADLAAFRIVQEAVANVVRHSAARTATVTLDHAADALVIEVTDAGPGKHGNGGAEGLGIVGMRERARLYGGTVEAGPVPGAGFRVRAVLPVTEPITDPADEPLDAPSDAPVDAPSDEPLDERS